MRCRSVVVGSGASVALLAAACLPSVQRTLHVPADPAPPSGAAVVQYDASAPALLKAHLRNGDVVRFSRWTVDSATATIAGSGERFDFNRRSTGEGHMQLPLDSVVLLESNRLVPGTSAALTVMTGVSLAGTAYCAANPKACFGSCPTIYVGDGRNAQLEAESFSSSVAPSLEATDLDALPSLRAVRGVATVHVRNEALETHNIRHMTLHVVTHAPHRHAFASEDGRFWIADRVTAPQRCLAAEGDCLTALKASGGAERTTTVDSTDLATREFVHLAFPASGALPRGIVLRARQSLVSTYLFYQTLAYLGNHASDWFAALERGDPLAHAQARRAAEALGGIEVQLQDATGTWHTVATSAEHGPLAADVRVLPLPAGSVPSNDGLLHVRLRLAKGAWRLDHVALAEALEPATAVALAPARVAREQRAGTSDDPAALAALRDSSRLLTTLPGDGLAVMYEVPSAPPAARTSYFLAVRGYYLEWMRRDWLAEQDPLAAAALLADPAAAMRTLAPRFARLEPTMEREFWGSRHALR
jgi:hypothetical protein